MVRSVGRAVNVDAAALGAAIMPIYHALSASHERLLKKAGTRRSVSQEIPSDFV
ncbi:MAG: hypothetical protein ACTSQ7_12760 [Alphaproteobacteria bacterium]